VPLRGVGSLPRSSRAGRIRDGEAASMPEPRPNLADGLDNRFLIERHKTMSDIEPTPLLREFEVFADQVRGWTLDCSCKIEGIRILPARFYLHKPNISREGASPAEPGPDRKFSGRFPTLGTSPIVRTA
jgi:hypothetical protein